MIAEVEKSQSNITTQDGVELKIRISSMSFCIWQGEDVALFHLMEKHWQ